MADVVEFGNYLKVLRLARGLTLRQVALYGEVSNSYLSQIERGERNIPSSRFLTKLAPVYKVPLEEMMVRAGYLPTPNVIMVEPEVVVETKKETLGQYISGIIDVNGFQLQGISKEAKINETYLFQIINDQERQPPPLILKRLAEVLEVNYLTLARLAGYLENTRKTGVWVRADGLSNNDIAEILAIVELKQKRRIRERHRRLGKRKPPEGG
ncbi:MAG: helix-turn-helix domain-containing protein [Peptococcaceae bacterium]|jgi:transcriptional regulator with XRE-family HTH domain|nr:helix-turn-helix domain-containing protein [Peptococcaceae bacterium]